MLDNKVVGNNIAHLRKQRKLTQQEVADKLFVTVQAVSGWERGQFLPSVDNLLDMSKLFECDIADILDEENLSEFVNENLVNNDSFSCAQVLSIVPFISTEQADEIASKMSEFDAYMLCGLAPFVSADCLYNLLLRCDDLPYEALCGVMPFLEPEQVSELLKRCKL